MKPINITYFEGLEKSGVSSAISHTEDYNIRGKRHFATLEFTGGTRLAMWRGYLEGYIRIMEKKMETTTYRVWGLGLRVGGT